MGVVYEAEQVSLGRRVALKVLPRQVSSDLKTLSRFRREARSAAQLHHTNIVPVFEVGKAGELSYYAMQFIQGQGLDQVIDELRRLKERAHPSGPAKEPERPDAVIPSGPTAPAPSRSRQVSRMALSLLTGGFVPETPGGSGEAEATAQFVGRIANPPYTGLGDAPAQFVRRIGNPSYAGRGDAPAQFVGRIANPPYSDDADATDAPPATDSSPAAASSPPSSVVLPGGKQLASSDDTTVRLWDVATGLPTRTLVGHESGLTDVAFSADSTRLASASHDKTVRLWDLGTGRLVSRFDAEFWLHTLAFSRASTRLAIAAPDDRAPGRPYLATDPSVRGEYGPGGRPGLHPGREATRLDQHGWIGEALGHRDRPGSPRALRSQQCGHERGLQPGWHSARHCGR
jgi:hypothetical protein